MKENNTQQKYDNRFHKWYVGEQGDVQVEERVVEISSGGLITEDYETVLAEYRAYVRDSKAELPKEVIETLRLLGKI
jgi:hypothetical protein